MPATTTLLGLVTPTQGTLSGTWGDTVNYGITDYVDIAIAGTLSFSGDGAITLANTTGSASGNGIGSTTAQYMVIRITGTQTVAKVITGPSYSKLYLVDHAGSTSAVTFKAAGQTGVSIAVGEKAFVFFNGTDYVKIAGTTSGAAGGSNTQVQFNSSGALAGSSGLVFDGTSLGIGSSSYGDAGSITAAIGVPGTTAGGLQLWASTAQEHYIQWGDSTTGSATYAGAISYSHASDFMRFWTASTEQMRLTSTGLGIGTSSPGAKLGVTTATAGFATILTNTNGASDSNGLYVKSGTVSTEYNLRLSNTSGSTDFMSVKGDGNVGIGTTSPSTSLTVSGANTAARGQVSVIGASSADARITLYRGSTHAGSISNSSTEMYIDAVEAVPLAFYTSDTKRAQISAAGGFSVGTTADPGAGAIYATGNITAYYSSDIKFKENVRDIPDALATVNAIGGKLFDWKDDYIESKGGADGYFVQKADFGVVAQDVQKVFPIAVRTREDGSLAVDYEKLGALAFAAVGELTALVQTLATRVEALEAK